MIKICKRLSRPDVFFYCGIWMMVLLIGGTISQKYMGLYYVQTQLFSSFFFWFYGIPLPASQTVMGLILTSLILKAVFEKRTIKKLGTTIIHSGIVLLLIGAFITSLFSKEGYVSLTEGHQSNVVSDYHKVELAIMSSSKKILATFNEQDLQDHKTLMSNLPFSIQVVEFMKNSEPVRRSQPAKDHFKGFAKIFELRKRKPEKINENNIAGLTFQIVNNNKIENYAVFEQMPVLQTIKWNKEKYIVSLHPIKTYLSFSLELIKFKKENYPGIDKVRSYESLVNVVDGQVKQRRLIKMNRPLRYKGYTFYQSSYIEGKNIVSILAAVKNVGRAFPYLSSLIICLGLLIHIFYVVQYQKWK